jgi:hypothetical protein
MGASSDGKYIITLDGTSRRCWSSEKQTKAIHDKTLLKGKRVLGAAYIERLRCFVSVFSNKKLGANKEGIFVNFWDSNMVGLNEVNSL